MDDWQYSFPELEGTATVKMVVDGEEITIEINGDDAPVTASNFADLVERDFYNGLMFHRVEEGFVAQGGDPQGRDPDVPPEELGSGGFIDPETDEERNIPLEIKPEGAEEPIYSQTFEDAEITVAPELPHIEGAIAMARTNVPDTASSQFYLALDDLPPLDGSYAVFGNVTEGMDVVEEIEIGDRIDYAVIVDGDIKSRSSSLISDSEKLNQLVNASNNAKVSLLADILDEEEEDDEDPEEDLLAEDDLVGEDPDDDLVGEDPEDDLVGEDPEDDLVGEDPDDDLVGEDAEDDLVGEDAEDDLVGEDAEDDLVGEDAEDDLVGE
ncbi:MAG: peptidylprolyl isomerase, partial [Cyanobacteriota bacterium]|nr:peptidylprolyl isomerase [Cyanobacteriota bacterium]